MGYNSTYDVQGNEVFLGTNSINPAMKEAAVDPSSITWGTVRPNIVVDASGNFVSTVAKPTT
jgi:glyceraldehyde-3-phosphate dehydrogenase/erythrose-4-phosphate dehydrogenase